MLSFLPDAEPNTPEVVTDLTNMVPTLRGYEGAPSMVPTGDAALAAEATGAAALLRLDGSVKVFAGTDDALYEASGSVWTDQSRVGGYTANNTKWRFAQFGDVSLAINKATVLQAANGGAFANVANSPKADVIETVGGQVMLANTDDGSTGLSTAYGDQAHRVWWSAAFDHTDWEPDVSTLAGSALLVATPGAVTGLRRLGNEIAAYKANSLYLGRFVGSPDVWRFDLISSDVGAVSHESVINIGYAHLFIGSRDIYAFDRATPVPISDGIREWFFERLNAAAAGEIKGLHDQSKSRVYWFYPSGASSTCNAALIYDYKTKRWGAADYAVQCAFTYATPGLTYDEFGTLAATYDDLPDIPYDSPLFSGGNPVPGVIDSTNTAMTLTGSSEACSLTTGFAGDPERWSLLRRIRPMYRTGKKPTTASATPSYVDSRGDTFTMSAASSDNNDRFDVLQSGRWHKVRYDWTGPVEFLDQQLDLVPQGYE